MSALAAACICTLLCPIMALSKPVITNPAENVQYDWAEHSMTVLGVGTPKILSPTGSVTPGPILELAQRDARLRLDRGLAKVSVDSGRDAGWLRNYVLNQTPKQLEVRYFSDGTVHLKNQWLVRAQDRSENPRKHCDRNSPGQLIVRLKRAVRPRFNLELEWSDGSLTEYGLAADPRGAPIVYWLELPLSRRERRRLRPRKHWITAEPVKGVSKSERTTLRVGGRARVQSKADICSMYVLMPRQTKR